MTFNQDKVLEVKDLKISFYTDNGILKAVRGVSFDLHRGETLCIVGESGSGKSVTSKAIMGILANNSIIEGGSILYEGENLLEISEEDFHRIRGKKIGMIFQDPLSSLNPIVRIGKQITEATLINGNKLKKMYNEIISDELVAYKNAQAHCKIAVKKAKDNASVKTKELNESLVKASEEASQLLEQRKLTFEDYKKQQNNRITEAQNSIKEFAAKAKNNLKNYKYEIKDLLSEDKAKYDANLAEYKAKLDAEVAAYKVETATKINALKIEVAQNIASYKAEFDASYAQYKNELNESLAQKKLDVNAKIVELKELSKNEILSAKNSLKEVLPELKAALKAKQKIAKEQVNAYKKELTTAHKVKMAELNAALKLAKQNKDQPIEPILEAIKKEKEAFENSMTITKKEAKHIALEIMREVGIPEPERRFKQYPFEFSGGMRQRIVIAIALIATPDILICDEPTTALDVTIQAQILELINRIKKERNLSCIFITHDLGVVANMADRVAVMYAGKIVEHGTAEDVFFDPRHPYTWALLSSIPDVDSKERLDAIPGTPPNMIYPPKGDAFALRSKYAMEIDFKYEPPFFKVSDTHYAATWLLDPRAPKVEMPAIVRERINNALRGEGNLDE